MQATETKTPPSSTLDPRPQRGRLPLRWLRRKPAEQAPSPGISFDRLERYGIRNNGFSPALFYDACPALRLRDDQRTHAPFVTAAHRCACAAGYVPDSVHQIVFCLTDAAHTACPRFDPASAPRPVDDGALAPPDQSRARRRLWRSPRALVAASVAAVALAVGAAIALSAGEEASSGVAAAGESAAVTPVAAAPADASSPVVAAPEPALPPSSVAPERAERPAAAIGDPLDDADLVALAALHRAGLPGPSALAPEPQSYVVAPGDTLLGIAAALGVDLDTILEVNALAADDPIFAGQVLQIPAGGPDPA